MNNPLKTLGESARDLSKNPIGIIALFIVLVYGFACLLFGFSSQHLTPSERLPLIWFIPVFPLLVLLLFAWLVTKHHDKLYSPSDYRTDEAFLETRQQTKQQIKPEKTEESEKNIKDLMDYGKEFEIISDIEKKIEEDLTARNLTFSDQTAKVLIHQLAASQVLILFEKIYYMIFGSQIHLLKILNENPSGVTEAFTSEYFDRIQSQYPKEFESWSAENYFRYLFTSGLIVKNDNKINITKLGKEFLIWLTKSGYAENKTL